MTGLHRFIRMRSRRRSTQNPGVQRVEQRPVQNRVVSLVEERVQRQQIDTIKKIKKIISKL